MGNKFIKGLILSSFIIILFSGFSSKYKNFPEINYTTVSGEKFTNENFKGKNTIVILFHLGCPGAMYLLKDLESLKGENLPEFVGVVENTKEQIQLFNDTSKNDWSNVRKYFKLNPVTIKLIPDCEKDITYLKDGNLMAAGSQCIHLGKKLKAKESPTIIYVNSNGEITKINREGYMVGGSLEARIKYLLNQ